MNTTIVEESEESRRRRRASKACLHCRKRKTRCKFDTNTTTCQRCREERLICEYSAFDKRGGYSNVLAGRGKRMRENLQGAVASQVAAKESSPDVYSPAPDESMLKNEMYNPNDAIEILHHASAGRKRGPSSQSVSDLHNDTRDNSSTRRKLNHGKLDNKLDGRSESAYNFAMPSTRRLAIHESAIVSDGVLTADEVCRLVGFFFAEIAPFYASYIPSEYQELARIAAEPALLAVVCTIGARSLEGDRYSDLHKSLWKYSQETVSRLLWECPMHHVRSLVFAVLTLAEWFPGALLLPNTAAGEALSRHTRICWPLMGQTVRLAWYVGLLKHDIQANIALHFTDHLLACRLGQQPMLQQMEGSENEFPPELVNRCTMSDRARLDIVKLLHLANRSLYRSRTETRRLLSSGQYTTILSFLYELVKKWKTEYREIVEGTSWNDRTTMFEFCHFELYVFSIALIPWQSSSSIHRLHDFAESQKYLTIAVDAAKSIVKHESDSDRPVQLRFSPIQWITRLLHAAVFLAKALLVGTVSSNKDELVSVLRIAAETMAKLPPDDQRIYSRPLERICRKYSSSASTSAPVNEFTTIAAPDSILVPAAAAPHTTSKASSAMPTKKHAMGLHDPADSVKYTTTPRTNLENDANRSTKLSANMPMNTFGTNPSATHSNSSGVFDPFPKDSQAVDLQENGFRGHFSNINDPQTISPLTDDGEENIWEFLLDQDILGHLANDTTPESSADFFKL